MTSTLQHMEAMRAQGLNARDIALKVHGQARFEGEVCSLLSLPPVTPSFVDKTAVKKSGGKAEGRATPGAHPQARIRALARLVAELGDLDGTGVLFAKPGKGRGSKPRSQARAVFAIMLIEDLDVDNKRASEILGYAQATLYPDKLHQMWRRAQPLLDRCRAAWKEGR